MQTRSLSTRLLLSVGIVMLLFFGVTIWVLDTIYRDQSNSAIATRLELQVSVLVSASDEQAGGKLVPGESLNQPRFGHLGSGLYGEIDRDDGEVMWRSESLTGAGLNLTSKLAPGKRQTRFLRRPSGAEVQALSVGLEWEFPRRRTRQFTFTVAEDLSPYRADLQTFRERLITWFSGLMLLLLAALGTLFRWVLTPIRQVEREIDAIETGEQQEFSAGYPRELVGITANMNAFLRSERERLSRYRNTLGNLAHSLKTPLAVARSLANTPQLQEQISRMDEIVNYQLKRAAMSGGTGLGTAPIDVAEPIESLRATLQKVYADKRVEIELNIDKEARFLGDKGDLLEVAGNVLDNACKWCRSKVRLTAQPLHEIGRRRAGLLLIVEDDGPGIAVGRREQVLKRGVRLDERVSGQGIGLSVVQELALLNGGRVEISDSSLLGGAQITVRLPAV